MWFFFFHVQCKARNQGVYWGYTAQIAFGEKVVFVLRFGGLLSYVWDLSYVLSSVLEDFVLRP